VGSIVPSHRGLALAALGLAIVIGAVVLLVDPDHASPSGPFRPRRPSVRAATPRRIVGTRLVRREFTIGHSVRGRPIQAVEVQSGRALHTILVVGCIHGNEPAGIAIARRLERSTPPADTAIWIIPDLNPDGVAADTRQNGDGVDLNRNFPWRWQPIGSPGDVHYSGPRLLSEPESRAAQRLILHLRPSITIWFHQHQDLVDLAGGDPAIERTYARSVALRTSRLPRYPGSAVGWENKSLPGTTAFDVELPAGSLSSPAVTRYTRGVLALGR
jgi:protein MpaA